MLHKNTDGAEDSRRAHIVLKAVTTTTDQGVFESVISTENVDREKDIVSAAGMVAALKRWNRPIPLSWNHSTKAEDIFGNVDSQTARELKGEVVVKGQVDLQSAVGAEAWRSFKSRTVGFSFGYLILASTKRAGGGRHITDLDIFEVTATPTPMNNDTRVLSTKGVLELGEEARRVAREVEAIAVPDVPAAPVAEPSGADFAADLAEVKAQLAETRQRLDEATKEPPKDAKALREEAERAAREVEEQQIPEVPEAPKAPEPPAVDYAQELQDVKTALAEVRGLLETLNKKADEADKGPPARSADPLRKQADTVALEIASDGQSLRKPPKTAPQKRPEPSLSLRELKQRTRDEMLGVLSGGMTE